MKIGQRIGASDALCGVETIDSLAGSASRDVTVLAGVIGVGSFVVSVTIALAVGQTDVRVIAFLTVGSVLADSAALDVTQVAHSVLLKVLFHTIEANLVFVAVAVAVDTNVAAWHTVSCNVAGIQNAQTYVGDRPCSVLAVASPIVMVKPVKTIFTVIRLASFT